MNSTKLTHSELIDLFKHWDTRVSQHELLFVPLSFAGLPAIAATCDQADEWLILAIAIGSLGLYLFHLLVIRRFALFQEIVFSKIKTLISDFPELLVNPKKILGVQRLRLFFLPLLGVLWSLILYAKLENITCFWSVGLASLVIIPLGFFFWLWLQIDKTT